MSRDSKRPGLSIRPPAPRNVEEFIEGAGKPKRRSSSPAARPERARPAQQAAQPPWEAPEVTGEGTERFLLRLQKRHHAMLRWLSEQSGTGPRRRSMQAVALDLLEPALEEAVRRRREELGG